MARAIEQIRKGNRKGRDITVSVVFPESIETAFGGANLGRDLVKAFQRRDIFVATEFPVKEITESEIIADDGRKIEYDLLMLLPPFRGQSFLNGLGVPDDYDFLDADESMRVPHFPGVYAVGDIVVFPV